jgi:glycine cleavage system H protein
MEIKNLLNLEGFNFVENLKYSDDHIWAKKEADENFKLGFDDIVARGSAEIFFIKILSAGTKILPKGKLGVIESRKYTGPIVSPFSGEIVSVNPEITKHGAHAFEEDPYEHGWLCIIKPENGDADFGKMMDVHSAMDKFREMAQTAKNEIGHEKVV